MVRLKKNYNFKKFESEDILSLLYGKWINLKIDTAIATDKIFSI